MNNRTDRDFTDVRVKKLRNSQICKDLLREFGLLQKLYIALGVTSVLWIPLLILTPLLAALIIGSAGRARALFASLNLFNSAGRSGKLRIYGVLILLFLVLTGILAAYAYVTSLPAPFGPDWMLNKWWAFPVLSFLPVVTFLFMSGIAFYAVHNSLKDLSNFLEQDEYQLEALDKFETRHAAELSLYESQCRELSRLASLNPEAFSGFMRLRHLVIIGSLYEAEKELSSIAVASGSAVQAADALEKAREFVRFCRENREILQEYRRKLEVWQACAPWANEADSNTAPDVGYAPILLFLYFLVLGPVMLFLLLSLL
ncbi:hypothetical protein [Succinimonas sp.]|uniref:hypothetical protein n=1 Tax=Succinimonas sp. TaxID=1936151 RepID=UPI003867E9E1